MAVESDGIFEAWESIDGKMTRVDNGNLETKEKTPQLGIARRGDKIYFMLNRQVGLESTMRGLSSNFKVMLYGFGSSENNWGLDRGADSETVGAAIRGRPSFRYSRCQGIDATHNTDGPRRLIEGDQTTKT
jgi:hypothetical protein